MTVAESAKALKKELAKAFPGTTFSVRCARGTGYGWVSVRWTDGPSSEAVEAITGRWETQGFDGMTDSTYSVRSEVEGSGIGQINHHRDFSDAAIAVGLAQLAADGWTGDEWAMKGAARAVCCGCSTHMAASYHHLRVAA